jgi:glycosyltransferase involved in cell wall biosynthesis
MAEQLGVLLVTNRLEHGGAEHMLITLALHLLDGPLRPVVACLKDAGPLAGRLRNRGVTLYTDLLRHRFDVGVLLRLRRVIEQESIGTIIAVGSGGDRMFWSTLAGRWCGIKVIVWSHVFPDPAHLGFEWPNRLLYRYVDRFVALGQRHRKALVEMENVPDARTVVIPNGIDTAAFDCSERRAPVRARLGLSDEQTAVAIVANLREDKRHDLFIQAAQILAGRYPTTRFYIVGDGPRREAVIRLARATNLLDRRVFLLGARDDVADLMQAFDVVCLCSEWQECLPITMIEAMAAGKAFVAPDMGSLDEALIDGQTGRFLRECSAAGLVEVLTDLMENPSRRADLGSAAQRCARERFTADQMARRFEETILYDCWKAGPAG